MCVIPLIINNCVASIFEAQWTFNQFLKQTLAFVDCGFFSLQTISDVDDVVTVQPSPCGSAWKWNGIFTKRARQEGDCQQTQGAPKLEIFLS